MVQKGLILHAILREDPQLAYLEVLACGSEERYIAAKMDDFERTTTGKTRTVVRVRLVVEEVVQEIVERPVGA